MINELDSFPWFFVRPLVNTQSSLLMKNLPSKPVSYTHLTLPTKLEV